MKYDFLSYLTAIDNDYIVVVEQLCNVFIRLIKWASMLLWLFLDILLGLGRSTAVQDAEDEAMFLVGKVP
jgi:hypothetical protein